MNETFYPKMNHAAKKPIATSTTGAKQSAAHVASTFGAGLSVFTESLPRTSIRSLRCGVGHCLSAARSFVVYTRL
jgi:hypothetical protein